MKCFQKLKKEYCFLLMILIVISILVFANINNSLLWKDEAITANIGYNTLKYGYPTVWDGKNLISSAEGNSFNQYLLSSNYEWLPYYLIAGSFALFGKTTFAARFPFAIFSVLSILLIWFISKRIFQSLRKTICCTLLYGLNVQFLLYSYQSRYYPLILFGIAWNILSFIIISDKLEQGYFSLKHSCLFALSIAFVFHSNRIAGISITMSIVLFIILKRKYKHWKIMIPLIIGAVSWAIWYLVVCLIMQAPSFGTESIETHFPTKILMICWKLQVYFFPFLSLIIISLFLKFVFIRKITQTKFNGYISLFVLIIICNVIVVAVPRWGIINHYFVPVLVVAPFLITQFIIYFYSISKHIAAIVILLLVFSNLFNIWPYFLVSDKTFEEHTEAANLLSSSYSATTNYGLISSPATDVNFRTEALSDYVKKLELRNYLYDYLLQTSSGYQSYLNEAIEFLNENATKDETILVMGFEFEPIMFYTDLRVVNNMNSKIKSWSDYFSSYPNQEKFEYLVHVDDDKIDWILYKNDGTETILFDDPNYLQENIHSFQSFPLNSANLALSNSPDLDYHLFENVVSNDNVVLYKRIK